MYYIDDSLGMLMVLYNDYVKECQKKNIPEKSFLGYVVASVTGNL